MRVKKAKNIQQNARAVHFFARNDKKKKKKKKQLRGQFILTRKDRKE